MAALVAAIHDTGYTSVEIGTNGSNLAVQRICDKIGATEKDRRPQPLPDGSTVSGIGMNITAWSQNQRESSAGPKIIPVSGMWKVMRAWPVPGEA
nr:hypothetical protein [Nocardia vaccinii]